MGKSWDVQQSDYYYGQYWPVQWKGKGQSSWKGKGRDQNSKKGEKGDKSKGVVFPKYDGTDPKQLLVVSEKRDEQDSLVREMQKAVSLARKAEGRTRRLQEELCNKERCWVQYQQELKQAYKTEKHRFQQDSARIREELAEAMLQERHAKQALQPSVDDQFELLVQSPETPKGKVLAAMARTPGFGKREQQADPGAGCASSADGGDLPSPALEKGQSMDVKMDMPVTRHTQYSMAQEKGGAVNARPAMCAQAVPTQGNRTYSCGGTPVAMTDPYLRSPSGAPSPPTTSPALKKPIPARTPDGTRVPVKQIGRESTPIRAMNAGASLEEKLAARRRMIEGDHVVNNGRGEGGTPDVDAVLRTMKPTDIPRVPVGPEPTLIYDDDDTHLSEDSDFEAWARMKSSDLPELD